VTDLGEILCGWRPGHPDPDISARVAARLGDVDLAEMDYADWLAENDPETYEDLYAGAGEDEEGAKQATAGT